MNDSAPRSLLGPPRGTPAGEGSTARAVRDMFERVAPRYDFLNHLLSAGCDIVWRRATARALRPWLERPGSRALDVCCGTGDLALAWTRYAAGTVLGSDFCRPMVRRARQKAARRARPPVFLEADSLALPFQDDSMDVVGVAFGFRNLADYPRGLREMRRVLKPSGTVAILEFSRVDWPLLGPLFRFYFRKLLPRIGTLVSGVAGPYQYLPASVERFPNQAELAALMRQEGFERVRYRNFFAGAAALHLGEKPGE
jgi:demethylmenaquinone methyltransferase / 2-methoxy-6-polyprenyl-1,4-benzoquinol methylase